jgi:regulator of protease activity HflC (stomatin/prohibitin superfamily)
MKKYFSLVATLLVALCMFTSCGDSIPAGSEGVFVYNALFAKGGVDPTPGEGGRFYYTVWTTDVFIYSIQPFEYDEEFPDAITSNNTPVDVNAYLTLRVRKGQSPALHSNFGEKWYENNIQSVFRELVRNEISKFAAFRLTSDRTIYDGINENIKNGLLTYIENMEMPIDIVKIVVGRASPNKIALEEMGRTAAQIQAKETQDKREEAETAREAAEIARAKADAAYMRNLGLTPSQFIALKEIENRREITEIIRTKENVNINLLIGGGEVTPNFPVR